MQSSDSVDQCELKVTQPNSCHSLHLVSSVNFEIGWRVGWVEGTIFAEETSEKCQPSCCLLREMPDKRNGGAGAAWAKCQLLPDPSKWDPTMHTRPIPSISDEPLKKGWNIQSADKMFKIPENPAKKWVTGRLSAYGRLKCLPSWETQEKSPSITKL